MRIIITGALGHIGSRLIENLWGVCSDVILIDNMSAERYCSLFEYSPSYKYRFIEADIRDINLEELIDKDDIVIHLAANTNAEKSVSWRGENKNHNLLITVKVAEACKKKKAKMIHLSSTSVYGSQESIVDETCDQLKPQSPYAYNKLEEEKALRKMKFKFVTLRLGTICGISKGMRFHTAVNKFCWQASHDQPITVWKTALHQKRPYLSLREAIATIRFIVICDMFDREIYNVVTDNLTVHDIVSLIDKHKDTHIKYVESPIMNQLSYNVLNNKIVDKGFMFKGNIAIDIAQTMEMLKC